MVTQKYSGNFACRKCEGDIGVAVEQKEQLCDEVETVREFAYLSDRVSAGGRCQSSVTARATRGCFKFRECGKLLFEKRFQLKLNGVVYKTYVRSTLLY